MITEKEYLKDYRTMNEEEKKDYLDRVKRWTDETFPELLALAECWMKVPVKDFDEGCRLVSAIVRAKDFLRDVQRYEARRALNKMNLFLQEVRKKSGLAKKATRGPVGAVRYKAIVPDDGAPDEEGNMTARQYEEQEVDGRRPKEFALYKDKLPKSLRDKGEKELSAMYLELAEYRGTLEVMAENPNVSDEARADMAQKAIASEQKIRAFWTNVDAALNGTYTEPETSTADSMKRPGDFTRAEIEAMKDVRQQEVCRKARVDGNKKYINRSDVKITEEYKEQLRLRIEELMEWGENLPKKTAEVATAAGIFIPGVNAPVSSEQAGTKSASTEKQEDKKSDENPVKCTENAEKRTENEEKRAGTTVNRTKTAEEPKKATETPRKKVDPTESVTEGQMKGGAQ
jgi:hypothetical protein|uniref:Uncharacterized protein n=1 Tax=Siphoviridae sp. ctHOG1 TaxID=2827829 RepID=A0A8S5SWA1_9CAUD|nr:MAG TPA: hypothetical protein [Siphoviridae sp. ctHOG1]